jgi:hypothetical protein
MNYWWHAVRFCSWVRKQFAALYSTGYRSWFCTCSVTWHWWQLTTRNNACGEENIEGAWSRWNNRWFDSQWEQTCW